MIKLTTTSKSRNWKPLLVEVIGGDLLWECSDGQTYEGLKPEFDFSESKGAIDITIIGEALRLHLPNCGIVYFNCSESLNFKRLNLNNNPLETCIVNKRIRDIYAKNTKVKVWDIEGTDIDTFVIDDSETEEVKKDNCQYLSTVFAKNCRIKEWDKDLDYKYSSLYNVDLSGNNAKVFDFTNTPWLQYINVSNNPNAEILDLRRDKYEDFFEFETGERQILKKVKFDNCPNLEVHFPENYVEKEEKKLEYPEGARIVDFTPPEDLVDVTDYLLEITKNAGNGTPESPIIFESTVGIRDYKLKGVGKPTDHWKIYRDGVIGLFERKHIYFYGKGWDNPTVMYQDEPAFKWDHNFERNGNNESKRTTFYAENCEDIKWRFWRTEGSNYLEGKETSHEDSYPYYGIPPNTERDYYFPLYEPMFAFEHGWRIEGCKNVTIEDCQADSLWGDGITWAGKSGMPFIGMNIIDCYINRTGRQIISTSEISNFNVKGNILIRGKRGGFDMEPNGTSAIIENGVIENNTMWSRKLPFPMKGNGIQRNIVIKNNGYVGSTTTYLGNRSERGFPERFNITFSGNRRYGLRGSREAVYVVVVTEGLTIENEINGILESRPGTYIMHLDGAKDVVVRNNDFTNGKYIRLTSATSPEDITWYDSNEPKGMLYLLSDGSTQPIEYVPEPIVEEPEIPKVPEEDVIEPTPEPEQPEIPEPEKPTDTTTEKEPPVIEEPEEEKWYNSKVIIGFIILAIFLILGIISTFII